MGHPEVVPVRLSGLTAVWKVEGWRIVAYRAGTEVILVDAPTFQTEAEAKAFIAGVSFALDDPAPVHRPVFGGAEFMA